MYRQLSDIHREILHVGKFNSRYSRRDARMEMELMERGMTHIRAIDLEYFGVKEFLKRGDGKRLVAHIEEQYSCCIELKNEEPDKSRSSQERRPVKVAEGLVNDCVITLWEGNLFGLQADALIHPVERSLMCESNLTTGLVKRGLPRLKQGIQAHFSSPGASNTVTTAPGPNLSFESIVHVVCPHSSEDDTQDALKAAILSALAEAANHSFKSLVLPPIGEARQFGFHMITVANSLMTALKEHIVGKTETFQHIDICDECGDMIEQLRKGFRDVFGSKMNKHPQNTSGITAHSGASSATNPIGGTDEENATLGAHVFQPLSIGSLQSSDGHRISIQYRTVTLQVKIGDITDERCDAIVTSIKDNMKLKDAGKVGQAILKKAGQGLQAECDKQFYDMDANGVTMTKYPGLRPHHVIYVSMQRFKGKWDEAVTKVLDKAERNEFASVALPVLGAGFIRADRDKLKLQIVDAIHKFADRAPTFLTDVRLVTYGQEMFEAFASILKQQLSDRNSFQFGTLRLQVIQGDITQLACDAIVDSVKDNMQLEKSGKVSQAIHRKCADPQALQAQCREKVQEMTNTGMAVTGSHGLPHCDHIVHLSMERYYKKWDQGVAAVLAKAEEQRFKTIALPVLGANFWFTFIKTLKTQIVSAIQKFGENGTTSLTDVCIVTYKQKLCETFVSFVKQRHRNSSQQTGSTRPRRVPTNQLSVSGRAGAAGGSQDGIVDIRELKEFEPKVSQTACVKVSGRDESSVDAAVDELKTGCLKAFHKETRESDQVKRFSNKQIKRLTIEGLDKLVQVSVNTEQGTVKMETFVTKDVAKIRKKLTELLKK